MDTAVTLSKTYKVGDYYNENGKEGVVFEVSADGNHGKIVSMVQSADWIQWSSDENEKVRLIGADSKTDGAYNMSKLRQIMVHNSLIRALLRVIGLQRREIINL